MSWLYCSCLLVNCSNSSGGTHGWMDGWMDGCEWHSMAWHGMAWHGTGQDGTGRMDGRTDGRTDGWMDGWEPTVHSTHSLPLYKTVVLTIADAHHFRINISGIMKQSLSGPQQQSCHIITYMDQHILQHCEHSSGLWANKLHCLKSMTPGQIYQDTIWSWWRHQMETFSALLTIWPGNSPVTSEFPAQRPVTQSFTVFFDLCLNKWLSKQQWGWWIQMPSCPLWRHCNVILVPKFLHWYHVIFGVGNGLSLYNHNLVGMAVTMGINAWKIIIYLHNVWKFKNFTFHIQNLVFHISHNYMNPKYSTLAAIDLKP